MSHTVHPYAHRLGINRDWKSRWFPRGRDVYKSYLKQDVLLREFLEKRLRGSLVGAIEMERGLGNLRILIKTARPGIIIGRSGEGQQKLRVVLEKKMRSLGGEVPVSFKLDVEDIKIPEANASVVGQMVAESLEKRMPFRRVLKQTIEKVMAAKDVKGVKIALAGRLDGAEMGRRESLKKGRLPLQTFRADVDYANIEAYTTYSVIGIKVWIYKGDVFAKDTGNRI